MNSGRLDRVKNPIVLVVDSRVQVQTCSLKKYMSSIIIEKNMFFLFHLSKSRKGKT